MPLKSALSNPVRSLMRPKDTLMRPVQRHEQKKHTRTIRLRQPSARLDPDGVPRTPSNGLAVVTISLASGEENDELRSE